MGVVESGGVHQDNAPATVRMETSDRLYRSCLGFQVAPHRDLGLPDRGVNELRMIQSYGV